MPYYFNYLGKIPYGPMGWNNQLGLVVPWFDNSNNSRVGTDISDLLSIGTLLGGKLKNSWGKTLYPDGSSSSWEADEIARDHDDAAAAKDEYDEYDE